MKTIKRLMLTGLTCAIVTSPAAITTSPLEMQIGSRSLLSMNSVVPMGNLKPVNSKKQSSSKELRLGKTPVKIKKPISSKKLRFEKTSVKSKKSTGKSDELFSLVQKYFEASWYEVERLEERIRALLSPENINAMNAEGDTLLHLAVKKGEFQFIRYLLLNGADPEIPGAQGISAFAGTCQLLDEIKVEIKNKKLGITGNGPMKDFCLEKLIECELLYNHIKIIFDSICAGKNCGFKKAQYINDPKVIKRLRF